MARERDGPIWCERAARLFCLCVAVGVGAVCVRYILPAAAPLIFAYFVSAAVHSVSVRLSAALKLPYGVCVVSVLILLILILFGGMFFICRRLMGEILAALGIFAGNGLEDIRSVIDVISRLPYLSSLPETYEKYLVGELSPAIRGILSSALECLGGAMGRVVRATPSAVTVGLITLIICFYMSVYHQEMNSCFLSLLPSGIRERVKELRKGIFSTLFGYVRAYLRIFILTFFEVLVGFMILCPQYALLAALCVAAVDILPIFGAGIVLVPWGISAILSGEAFIGVGMLVLYVVVTVIRQIAEPRLVGEAVGLHPLVSLVVMFLGYRLFGFAGMMLSPIVAVCVKRSVGTMD